MSESIVSHIEEYIQIATGRAGGQRHLRTEYLIALANAHAALAAGGAHKPVSISTMLAYRPGGANE